MTDFEKDLIHLIRKHGLDSILDTADFILAHYLHNCLKAFHHLKLDRETWLNKAEDNNKILSWRIDPWSND